MPRSRFALLAPILLLLAVSPRARADEPYTIAFNLTGTLPQSYFSLVGTRSSSFFSTELAGSLRILPRVSVAMALGLGDRAAGTTTTNGTSVTSSLDWVPLTAGLRFQILPPSWMQVHLSGGLLTAFVRERLVFGDSNTLAAERWTVAFGGFAQLELDIVKGRQSGAVLTLGYQYAVVAGGIAGWPLGETPAVGGLRVGLGYIITF